MEDFDYTNDQFEEEPKRAGIHAFDILAVVLLLASVCLGGYFLTVFANPYSGLNPFPPATPIPPLTFPTATITPLQLDAVWTSTPTIQPTPSFTPRPTWTPFYTPTPFSLFEPTYTPAPPEPPTASPTPGMPFTATIQQIDATIIHPDTACNWMGVGGTVEDLNKSPILGVVVRVGGTLVGSTVDYTTVTGVSPAYGKSGFEFVLGEAPLPSTDTMWIRLFDQAGLPLSDEIRFSTSSACNENLVLVRFTKVR
ncbi:MAG: hypothetical protein L3J16_01730 [Anaerolineales bacterium]|nr:hypothetical protein [Anaerolineales bacterium]